MSLKRLGQLVAIVRAFYSSENNFLLMQVFITIKGVIHIRHVYVYVSMKLRPQMDELIPKVA